jgi:hypothetical protein
MTELDPHTVTNGTLPATIEEYGDGQTTRSRQVIIDLADYIDGWEFDSVIDVGSENGTEITLLLYPTDLDDEEAAQ